MLAGKGMYARKSFQKGDLITISPVLLIPKKAIATMSDRSHSIIQNYCMSSPLSRIAIFPFGWGAVANHASPRNANIELSWYWWDNDDNDKNEKERKIKSTLMELSEKPYAQLDLA